jgi:hypothetical protein
MPGIMHKAAIDMSKGFDAILDTALVLEGLVKERQQTPDAAITALAMALGKVCADFGISLDMAQELVRISYTESGKRGSQA